MKCPVCGQHSAPSWRNGGFQIGSGGGYQPSLDRTTRGGAIGSLNVAVMYCANEECGELLVKIDEQSGARPVPTTQSWPARPQFASAHRDVHPLVPEPFRTDYNEAAGILSLSPRISAVNHVKCDCGHQNKMRGEDLRAGKRCERCLFGTWYPSEGFYGPVQASKPGKSRWSMASPVIHEPTSAVIAAYTASAALQAYTSTEMVSAYSSTGALVAHTSQSIAQPGVKALEVLPESEPACSRRARSARSHRCSCAGYRQTPLRSRSRSTAGWSLKSEAIDDQ